MPGEMFHIKSDSPVADDLMFWRVVGHESLSRPSFYELTVLSKDGSIQAKDILGRSFDVVIDFHGADNTEHERHCQGYAVRFARAGEVGRFFRYQIALKSWFGLLDRRSNSRILQDKTSKDIFNAVVDDSPISRIKKFEPKSYNSNKEHRYCVQFQETDYKFLSHLMEEEGVYYWFDTHDNAGTMYASTASDVAHKALPAADTLKYVPTGGGDARFNEITRWAQARRFSSGKYASRDSDFKAIKKKLKADKGNPASHELADLEVFEFYGDFFRNDDTEAIAGMRMEELSSREQRYWALTGWPDVAVGRSFNFKGDPNQAADGEYLIGSCSFVVSHPGYESLRVSEEQIPLTSILHTAMLDDAVNADFLDEWMALVDAAPHLKSGIPGSRAFFITVMPTDAPYRVPRLTPRVTMPGPQSGIVVGPEGEEIHADSFGRVKVHFHWDRYDESNEKSTAWIRVSQPWAGKGWGGYFIPRIGQEVIVDFLNGDPDRPIIVGRVYNDDQPIPFESHTQSGFRTRSTPGGSSANCNEFRFDDKKGAEQVYLHAEKNQDISVENDETHTVGHDRKKTIDHDETNHIKNDRTETVGNNEKIDIGVNRTESVGSNEEITIGANRTEKVAANEDVTIGANRTHTVGASDALNVAASRTATIGASQTETVAANLTQTVGAAVTQTIGAAFTQTVGGPITVTSGGPTTFIAAGGFNIIAPAGTKVIDNSFEKFGGKLFEGYGIKINANLLNNSYNAVKIDVNGVNLTYSVLKVDKVDTQLKTEQTRILGGLICLAKFNINVSNADLTSMM